MHVRMVATPENLYPNSSAKLLRDSTVPLQVFVVEDSPAVRDIMLEQLEQLPNVTCSGHADSQANAIEDLRRIGCDVVILDIKLKTGTGLGVLRALSAADFPNPPITRIIFSNYADNEFRAIARDIGATHFFDKTQDFPALLALISSLAST
jgi:DNA-binding NarL/FixJ family response regulator